MLGLDALAVSVCRALEGAGLDVLLMKGPVTNSWLYERATQRAYSDVDLLVRPHDRGTAVDVLRRLGFVDHHASVLGIYRPAHEQAWVSDRGVVDLHWSLDGIPPSHWAEASEAFFARGVPFGLAGADLTALGLEARLMQLALHAAGAAPGDKAHEDLRRGTTQVDLDSWRDARRLATRLGAEEAFVAGLSRSDLGHGLLLQLGLNPRPTRASLLAHAGASAEAHAIERVLSAPPGSRLEIVRRWFGAPGLEGRALQRARLAALRRLPRGVMLCARSVRAT